MSAQADPTQVNLITSTLIAVAVAIVPVIASVVIQGIQNMRLERQRNRAAMELAQQQNDFAIAREKRDEIRERENRLWQLELDKFQRLESFLKEFVLSVQDATADLNAIQRDLWLLIEEFNMGFPNYSNVSRELYELEALYINARQNMGDDYTKLRKACHSVVGNCRMALMIGLPITIIEDGKAYSKPRTDS